VVLESPSYFGASIKALVDGPHKLFLDFSSGDVSVFDLRSDPGESTDVSGRHPAIVAQGTGALRRHLWAGSRQGSFHLYLPADAEKPRRLSLSTDGIFDADVALPPDLAPELSPDRDAAAFTFDPARRRLELLVPPSSEPFEVRFWFRGATLSVVAPDGSFATHDRVTLLESRQPSVGDAELWFEGNPVDAATASLPREDLLRLRALGYVD
jgi:hypothetical protein